MYTFRICPASAILSVPKSHGQHINMQICCMYLSRMSSVIPSASAVRMAVRILVYCFLCCTRRISAAWCSFPRRASGTALRPTRTRSSFRSCSPPLHRQMENQSRTGAGDFRKGNHFRGAGAAICAGGTLRHACTGNLCLPENTLLGSRYQACL